MKISSLNALTRKMYYEEFRRRHKAFMRYLDWALSAEASRSPKPGEKETLPCGITAEYQP